MMRFWSNAYVKHLEGEILWLRLELQKQQQRAEDKANALVALRTQGQVTLAERPLIADREKDVETEIKDLMRDSEWSQVGT
jgi:hypothetical protein